jgi:hypothetical protein
LGHEESGGRQMVPHDAVKWVSAPARRPAMGGDPEIVRGPGLPLLVTAEFSPFSPIARPSLTEKM